MRAVFAVAALAMLAGCAAGGGQVQLAVGQRLAGVPDQREFPAFDVVQIIAADLLGAGHRHDQALVAVIAADDDGIALAKVLGQEFLDGGEALVGQFAPNTIGCIGIADDPVSILVVDGRSVESTPELKYLIRLSYA